MYNENSDDIDGKPKEARSSRNKGSQHSGMGDKWHMLSLQEIPLCTGRRAHRRRCRLNKKLEFFSKKRTVLQYYVEWKSTEIGTQSRATVTILRPITSNRPVSLPVNPVISKNNLRLVLAHNFCYRSFLRPNQQNKEYGEWPTAAAPASYATVTNNISFNTALAWPCLF